MHILPRFRFRLWLLCALAFLGAVAGCQTNDTVEFIPLGASGDPDAQARAEGGEPSDGGTASNADGTIAASGDGGGGTLDGGSDPSDGSALDGSLDGGGVWTCVAGPGGPGWPVGPVCPATEGPVTCVTEETEDGGDAGVQCRPQNTIACAPPCAEGGCTILPDPDAAIACGQGPCEPGGDARACVGWTPCADRALGACFVWFVAEGGVGGGDFTGWWQGTFKNPSGVWVH
jgi:hypothetical protein